MYIPPFRAKLASNSASPLVLPSSPAGLPSPASWIDMSQEAILPDGMAQLMLSDRANARTFTTLSGGTYRTNVRNGLPVLRTTSSLSAYVASSAPVIAASSPFCLWFVGQSNGADAIVWGNTAPNNQVRINYTGNLYMYLFGGAETLGAVTALESTAWNIYLYVRDSSNNSKLYLNGLLKGSGSTLTSSINLARFLESFSVRFVGDFAEAGYNAADFSKAQLNSLGSYLGNKWAIAWNTIT